MRIFCCYQCTFNVVHISMWWYLTSFAYEGVHVFQSDPCFSSPYSFMNRFSKNTDFYGDLVYEQCDMRFSNIDKETKVLRIMQDVMVHYYITKYILIENFKK